VDGSVSKATCFSKGAAEAGKHILCEKPLAVRPVECRKMIDAAKANDVLLLEAFIQHFSPLLERMLSLVTEGAVGELNFVRAELCYTLPDWDTDVRGNGSLDGGALFDAGCYCVNVVRTVMSGEPEEVSGFQRVHEQNRVDSLFTGLMKFPGDKLAYISTAMEQPFRFPVEIVGTDGVLYTPNLFQGTDLSVRKGSESSEEKLDPVNRFALQLDHFSDAVLGIASLRIGPEDGLLNAAVLDALKTSAGTGKRTSPRERI
jgi:predicted dehydrogenase